MKLQTEILQDLEGTISITDYQELEYYLPDDSPLDFQTTNTFKYKDTETVNVIEYQSSNGEELVNAIYSSHSDEDSDSIRVPLTKDGYYTVNHLVLPIASWVHKLITDHPVEDILLFSRIYFIDSENVYYLTTDECQLLKAGQADISDVIEMAHVVDPQLLGEVNTLGTTISVQNFNVFNTSGLRHCYVHLSRQILEGYLEKCKKKDCDLIFNRDFIWMTLNVIKFYTDENRFSEAQLVLEQLNCYKICDNINFGPNKTSNCGCMH